MGFYRKKKFGIFDIGISTKGLGISTGIKGLRIGISSTGTPYVSTGLYGFNYRKNLTSKKNKIQEVDTTEKEENLEQEIKSNIDIPKKLKNRQIIFLLISIVSLFLIFKSELFIILSCFSFFGLCCVSLDIIFKEKKCNQLISKAIDSISISDMVSFEKILVKSEEKLKYKELIDSFYKETYLSLLEEIVSDNEISAKESEMIDLYKKNLSEEDFMDMNSSGIDFIVASILNAGKITGQEKNQLDLALRHLPLSKEKNDEINNLLENLEKIIELNKNGLSVIEKQKSFNEQECFYRGKITNITRHSKKGIYSFEESDDSELFIDNEFLHFIGTGHRKIEIKQIISSELQNGFICFIIENKQKPFYIKTDDSLLILSIISCIQKN